MWEPQWQAFTEGRRAIRCDLRGFGESPLPPGEFNNSADVHRLLDELEVERATVVGASFGGRVALELAATWPRRVERLILLCAAWEGIEPDDELRSFGDEEECLLEAGDIDGAVELNLRTWLGPEVSAAHRSLVAEMQRLAFELQLEAGDAAAPQFNDVDPATIDAPTLVVSGARDLTHFREVAGALASGIPDAEHRELAWAGHLPSLERPDLIQNLVLAY